METGTLAETIARVNAAIEVRPYDAGAYDDLLSLYKAEMDASEADADGLSGEALEDRAIASRQWHTANRVLRDRIVAVTGELVRSGRYRETERFNIQYRRSLLMDAKVDFDAYMLYIESDREPQRRFWLPRREILKPIADDMVRLIDGDLRLLAISLPPGVGKALANDTPIMTRNGWKKHGDLAVGDEVIGLDGKFKKVIAVHPKCMLDCLVEFSNGEKIQCHENHEWLIHDRGRHITAERDYIAETKRLEKRKLNSGAELGHRGHRYTVQLPHRGYAEGEAKQLPLDPYTLGVWLGDGANRNPRVCCASKDRSVIDRIVRNGHPVRWSTVHKVTSVLYFDFDIRRELQSIGMCHSRRVMPKHIPEVYLTASIEQRLQLLAGLLDTDGTLTKSKYQFTTAEESLRDSFIDLLSTFGWRACVIAYAPKMSSSGVHARKQYYMISFTPDCEIPCELERKRNKEPHEQRAIGFKNITRVEPKQGNCITVEGDGMYLAGKTMIPTHNTTLAIFFLTWIGGRWPDEYSVVFSHDGDILKGMYGEVLRIISADGEYLWRDVFPDVPLVSTNAKDMRIDLGHGSRFETVQFASVGSDNAGKVRASKLLYCDDLVGSIEQAMSKERLDKLWTQYTTDIQQRGTGDYRELHIATRWSVWDVIGRLERQEMDAPTGRAKFIAVPALNEKDESNFDYPGIENKFTTERYRLLRDSMDDVNWRALYMNEPIEREGQLYSEEELRRYFELPPGEPDAIIAACDTKAKGTDYCALPVAYRYGEDYYIDGAVCDNGDTGVVEEKLAVTLTQHRVQMAQFESNSAGWSVAEKVQKRVRELGGRCSISTKPTTANKETKVIVNAPWVKEHCLFRDKSLYRRNSDYGKFMEQMMTYTVAGRNKNDDVVDVLAQLALYAQSFETVKVVAFQRPY